jgi:hypothetical protein
VVIILAFDWYFLPPLRKLDAATVLVLGLFLVMAVIVGAFAARAGAARPGQRRHEAFWRTSRRRCAGWRRWSPASPRQRRFSRQ